MKKIRLHCILVASTLLMACNTPRSPAPVSDRGTASRSNSPHSNVAVATLPSQGDQRGYYTVRKGDTLLRIALEFGQGYRDLVSWNNLANPNDIKVDQVLRIMPPDSAAGAPQAASVSVGTGVEVRALGTPLAVTVPAMNNKNGPYGEKKPYSDSTLAEMQKPEAASYNSHAAGTSVPAAQAVVPAANKSVTTTASAAEEENISWIWPTDGKLTSGFDDGKKGIDIAGKSGQPVVSASAGKVMYAGSGIRGYGNLVIVKHTSNVLSAYAHNKTILVKEGQIVTKGQKIAEMGNSDADTVKLHFEIRQQGKPVDPAKFLPAR